MNIPSLDFSCLGLTLICWVGIKSQGMESLCFYIDSEMTLYYYNPEYIKSINLLVTQIPPDIAYPFDLKDYLNDSNYVWEPEQLEIAKKYSVMMELIK